ATDTVYFMESSLCVGATSTQCAASTYNPGYIYAANTTVQGADYAEYFLSQGDIKSGDIVGIQTENGELRLYQSGDLLLGIVSTSAGMVGNQKIEGQSSTLVALMGQVPFNQDQVFIDDGRVRTLDGQMIGILLSSGDVYLNISSSHSEIQELKKENQILKKGFLEVQELKKENQILKSGLLKVQQQLKLLLTKPCLCQVHKN
ncbi:hypothetical protein MJH12_12790, partial [bacterium]|nr:hypothetical protein [bacterium]